MLSGSLRPVRQQPVENRAVRNIGRFPQLVADRHGRVERSHRVLRDRTHKGAARVPQAIRTSPYDLGTRQQDRPSHLRPMFPRQKALHRKSDRRFARTAFADDGHDLTRRDIEADIVEHGAGAAVPVQDD